MPIRVCTYNILNPGFNRDPNYAPDRTKKIVANLEATRVDIAVLQEVSEKTFRAMESELGKGYKAIYWAHPDRDDGIAFIVKEDRLKLVGNKHKISGRYRQGFIDLQLGDTDKIIRVAGCHLQGGNDGYGQVGRDQIDDLVNLVETEEPANRAKEKTFKIAARIIAGDFNQDQHQMDSYKIPSVMGAGYAHDLEGNPELAYSETEVGKGRQLDWVWVKAEGNNVTQKLEHIAAKTLDGFLPKASDHLPKITDVVLSFPDEPEDEPVVEDEPLQSPIQFVPANWKHTQPEGSFREKIMRHFLDKGGNIALASKLDEILSENAKILPPLSPNDFKAHVFSQFAPAAMGIMNVNDADQFLIQLNDAFLAAQTEASAASAAKKSIPQVQIQAQQPIVKAVKPSQARPAIVASPAPVSRGQRLKNYLATGLSNFAKGFARLWRKLFG